jgi:hypothetical protein
MDEYKYQVGFNFVFDDLPARVFSRSKKINYGKVYCITDAYGDVFYLTEVQIDAAVAQHNSTKGEVNTEKKERTFTKEEVLDFVDFYVGDVVNFDVAFDVAFDDWVANKEKQADPEYQEFLRLKDKFRD